MLELHLHPSISTFPSLHHLTLHPFPLFLIFLHPPHTISLPCLHNPSPLFFPTLIKGSGSGHSTLAAGGVNYTRPLIGAKSCAYHRRRLKLSCSAPMLYVYRLHLSYHFCTHSVHFHHHIRQKQDNNASI